ncbi:MAG: hypothetical protein HZC44_11240 [Geobacter sp.]|nr:hypothetical protein [Geobacter sp.]
MREGNAKILRTGALAVAGAVSLILFSMLQKKIMGVAITFTPRALVVPVLFGGSSGLLIGIWQERLHRAMQEIVALNQTLEAKVAERTASLEEATYELTILNENLQAQRNALERTNQELEAFSYSVSHDLRAPLRHINSYSNMLVDNFSASLSEEGQAYVQRICRATHRMEGLIDALLQFSRVARAQIVAEEVDLSELAQTALSMLSESDPERSVSIRIAEGLRARGDRRLLEIVLQNLLGNAWKYTVKREDALIAFDRTQIDGRSWFLVRDNGTGFDMKYAERLFQPFQRLHGQEYDGTGIGLATVKRIIERHGGEIRAEGRIDAGASFFFHLGNN